MKISIMAAMSQNRVIGKEGRLPWLHIPADWANLHRVCYGKPMIMGRKSYDTPDRVWSEAGNVVITRQLGYDVEEGFVVEHSLAEAIQRLSDYPEVFVIGGEEIFRQALPLVDTIHLTVVHQSFEGDAFFPTFEDDFIEASRSDFKADGENLYDYSFLVYERHPHLVHQLV
jgi:dihydrofolate reductase